MRWPLSFFTAKRLPPQSGKYTASPSTVGVAETSPPVVNTHFGFRPLTSEGLMECSAGWLQVLLRFWPALRHWPDRASVDWLCALSAETSKRTLIIAVMGNDTLRFFTDICILLLLELSRDYTRLHFFDTAIPPRETVPRGQVRDLGVHLYRGLDAGSGPRITSNIVGVSDAFKRKPLFLPAFGAVASILRAGQSKRIHFVISDSGWDTPITRSPIDGAVHD